MVNNPALYTCTNNSTLKTFPTYTVLDCRPEQRARWQNIRWKAHMQQEKADREATVQRWKERSRMKREDKDSFKQL